MYQTSINHVNYSGMASYFVEKMMIDNSYAIQVFCLFFQQHCRNAVLLQLIKSTKCIIFPTSVGTPHGLVVNLLDCDILVCKFKLKSCCYVYFRTDTLGKGKILLIPRLCVK